MGIGEKKSVLRGMYEKPAVEASPVSESAASSAPASVSRSERFEARLDRFIYHFVHVVIYVLFLLGLAGMIAVLRSHYNAGLALGSTFRFERYFKDTVYLIGLALFLILIGTSLFTIFRQRLPRRWKWLALGAILSLLPCAIVSACFFSTCFHAGRAAAFAQLDSTQLLADARSLAASFPLTDGEPRDITAADPGFSALPKYTSDAIHPDRLRICPRGIVIVMASSSPFGDLEGLIVPTEMLSPADAQAIAERSSFELLGGVPPIFHFTSEPDLKFLDDPGHPSTLPGLSPWSGR